MTPSSTLKPGDFVGPYEIRGFLGQGGMGQVYRGFDPRLERTVALKVIVVPTSTSEADSQRTVTEFSLRLLREARAVASLSHPNVVGIYDVGESTGKLYLAMEYVVGATVRVLHATTDIPFARRLRWLIDIARALDAAHRAGLVHRDVKPENVMIREDGVVKVLDFGIARRAVPATGEDQRAIDTVTGGGAVAGTPLYMAPEQIRGGEVDARCDQFGWAVMAYELLAGARPWADTGNVLALVAKVLTDPAPSLRGRSAEIPRAVDETILRALAKDPDARFPTMAHVADALEPFATHDAGRAAEGQERVRILPPPSDDVAAYAATTRVPTNLPLPKPRSAEPRLARRTRSRWFSLGLPLLVGVGLATTFVVERRAQAPRTSGPSQPRPLSTVPEADGAFKEAMRLWHDGAASKARTALRRSVELDPSFAAAQLEIAMQAKEDDPATAQAAFQTSFENRAMLLPRDAALLDASEPYVRAKPDLDEWETRMTSMVFQYPRDAELQLLLGRARERRGDDDGARTAYEAAARLDPTFVPAIVARAAAERHLGHPDKALALADQCVKQSPIASMCVASRYRTFADQGSCHDARSAAEQWRTLEPQSPAALGALGRALHADGAKLPSVEEVLSQSWSLLPETKRARAETKDRMYLALDAGDLDRAIVLARAYDEQLPQTANQQDHALAARTMATAFLEAGELEDAVKVAHTYLDRMDAWPVYPFASDPSVFFYVPLHLAGELTGQELDAQRTRWAERERQRLPANLPPDAREEWSAWANVWGAFVDTREDATQALSRMPTNELPPGTRRAVDLDFTIGKVYALAGHPKEALEHLARVTGSCASLENAILVIRAHLLSGMSFEALGATDKAQEAYRRVIALWPNTPTSRTVKAANERLEALSRP